MKTQACHTPATNSDASAVHPVADSAWGTVKAQARHRPATFSDISTIHPAADSAGKNLKAESVPVRATSDKVIIQDGRSDPAAHSFEEFRLADASICFATRSEADEAMREMSVGRGLAILTMNIARVFAKKEVLFPKTCCRFFFSSAKVLVLLLPATRCSSRTIKLGPTSPILRSSVLLILQARRFRCRFCQPAVRPVPSRFVARARNSQVSQGDVSHELFVSIFHRVF